MSDEETEIEILPEETITPLEEKEDKPDPPHMVCSSPLEVREELLEVGRQTKRGRPKKSTGRAPALGRRTPYKAAKEAKEAREAAKEEATELKESLKESLKDFTENLKESTTRKRKSSKSTKKQKEDSVTEDLRNELKLLILKHAENTHMAESELKRELNRAARVKENDLPFELDKQRLKVSGSWTKGFAVGVKNGAGLLFDKLLKADGHIAKEFAEDKNLEAAIHTELEKFTFLMNPRLRIGVLGAKDVATGYVNKIGAPSAAPSAPPPFPPLLIRQNGLPVQVPQVPKSFAPREKE